MVAHKPYNVNRFIEKSNPKVFPCRGGGVPDAPQRYYYHPTTDTKTTDTKGSPKTFDAGIALYVGMALTSAAGVAFVGKKRGN